MTTCEIIESLESEWGAALCSKDVEKLRALIHPDFTLIGSRPSGPFRMRRDDWLEAIQKREVESIDLRIQDASAYGDTMVGTIFATWRLRYLGRIVEDCVVLTDVWVRNDNQWQVIRRHSTPSPSGQCAEGI